MDTLFIVLFSIVFIAIFFLNRKQSKTDVDVGQLQKSVGENSIDLKDMKSANEQWKQEIVRSIALFGQMHNKGMNKLDLTMNELKLHLKSGNDYEIDKILNSLSENQMDELISKYKENKRLDGPSI